MSGRIFAVYQPLLKRSLARINQRLVSTSKKNNDTATTSAEACNTATAAAKAKAAESKEWISYGFERYSKTDDRNAFHSIMFTSVTLCLVVGGFYMAYYPDLTLRDWAQREGYLELKRRESAGKPLIDPNYVDPANILLPSDEELGNTEIII